MGYRMSKSLSYFTMYKLRYIPGAMLSDLRDWVFLKACQKDYPLLAMAALALGASPCRLNDTGPMNVAFEHGAFRTMEFLARRDAEFWTMGKPLPKPVADSLFRAEQEILVRHVGMGALEASREVPHSEYCTPLCVALRMAVNGEDVDTRSRVLNAVFALIERRQVRQPSCAVITEKQILEAGIEDRHCSLVSTLRFS